MAWEKHILFSPAGGLCGARLWVSTGILLSRVRGARRCTPVAVFDSGSWEGSDSPGVGAEGAGPSPNASFSLPGQGSVLIKMPSLRQRQRPGVGCFPKQPRPLPLHPVHRSDFSAPAFSQHSKADASILPGAGNVRRMTRGRM